MGDAALIAAILEPRTPPDVREFRPEVDAETAAILKRMLNDDPDQRFASTAALVQALSLVQDPPFAQRARVSAEQAVDLGSKTDRVSPPTPLPIARPVLPARLGPVSPPVAIAASREPSAPTEPRGASAAPPSKSALKLAAVALVAALAGAYVWNTQRPVAPVQAPASAAPVEPPTPTAPGSMADPQAPDPLQSEAWAKYLLARYQLHSADGDDLTLNLLDQKAGVIAAELVEWEDEPIELSGRVESNATEKTNGEDWDVYRVKMQGPADLTLHFRVAFTESATAGEGILIEQGERTDFKILDSEDL